MKKIYKTLRSPWDWKAFQSFWFEIYTSEIHLKYIKKKGMLCTYKKITFWSKFQYFKTYKLSHMSLLQANWCLGATGHFKSYKFLCVISRTSVWYFFVQCPTKICLFGVILLWIFKASTAALLCTHARVIKWPFKKV